MYPEEVAAAILSAINRQLQQKYPGHPIKAVVSVPAYFEVEQRKTTLHAAQLAGLPVSDNLIEGKQRLTRVLELLTHVKFSSCQNLLRRHWRTTGPRWLITPAKSSWSLIWGAVHLM